MMTPATSLADGRFHQKNRTRRHLAEAAIRLQDKQLLNSLADVAEEAQVSRATVYRYFSSISDLRTELALSVRIREPEALFRPGDDDPRTRVLAVHAHLFELVRTNEAAFRAYLKSQMENWERNQEDGAGGLREGRRARLLEAALEGLRDRLKEDEFAMLVRSLSLLTFIEPYILLKDIFGLDDATADATLRWAIEKLLAGALASASE